MENESIKLEEIVSGGGLFVGEFTHALDPKKRLTIPSVWRALVGAPPSLYVLPDLHHRCLNVFPMRSMVQKLEKIRSISLGDKKGREFARILGEASDLVAWDSQGRIRIKDKLLDFGGLGDRVVMIGAFDRFELWSPDHRGEAGAFDQPSLEEAATYIGF